MCAKSKRKTKEKRQEIDLQLASVDGRGSVKFLGDRVCCVTGDVVSCHCLADRVVTVSMRRGLSVVLFEHSSCRVRS